MYVPPGSTIYFGKNNPAGVFGYLRNGGNISIQNNGQVYFLGKIWMNEIGSLITDSTTSSNSINGGFINFVQPNPVYGNMGQQLFEAGYSDVLASGPAFSNIVIDNNAGVALTSDMLLLSTLQFKRGHLFLNKYSFVLGDSLKPGKVAGYNERSFIVTASPQIGWVKYRSIPGSQLVTFPIGPNVGSYAPLQLTNGGNYNDFFVTSFDKVLSNAISGVLVTDSTLPITWAIARKNISDDEVLITLQHDMLQEDPVFRDNRDKSYISLHSSNGWDKPYVLAGVQNPGNLTSSFPIASAFMNSRKLMMKDNVLYLSKKVTQAPKALRIPNVFSPNGDNINDKWIIPGTEAFPSCLVEVFNRYGQSIFRSVGYQQPWDGTLNGSPLPVATYYYMINLRNGEPPITGNVTILR
jgi:gliding motility-associated-like protein